VPQSIDDLIPYAHVADLERSIEFYRHLGLELEGDWRSDGERVWALLSRGKARLMLAVAGERIDPTRQAVLFYLYAADVVALRDELVAARIEVCPVAHPDYMPAGEIRVADPDGYVLLIGQLESRADVSDS
jgi:catechol 2,3-dioxygenase-like lactoylglutathione lyase family enzyme